MKSEVDGALDRPNHFVGKNMKAQKEGSTP